MVLCLKVWESRSLPGLLKIFMVSSAEINQNFFKKLFKSFLKFFNYKIVRINNFNDRYNDFIADASEEDLKNIEQFSNLSLTTKANLWSIIQSLKYLDTKKITGDLVECGVFKGGTIAMMLKYLSLLKVDRKIYGYDTFEQGMLLETYTSFDTDIKGKKILDLINLNEYNILNKKNFYPTIEEVKQNIINLSKIKSENLILIKGNILETLMVENNLPKRISF
jgi:O-methyltransferase